MCDGFKLCPRFFNNPTCKRWSLLPSPGVVPTGIFNSDTHRTLSSTQLSICMLSLPILMKLRLRDSLLMNRMWLTLVVKLSAVRRDVVWSLWQTSVDKSQCRSLGFWRKSIPSTTRTCYALLETVLGVLLDSGKDGTLDPGTLQDRAGLFSLWLKLKLVRLLEPLSLRISKYQHLRVFSLDHFNFSRKVSPMSFLRMQVKLLSCVLAVKSRSGKLGV